MKISELYEKICLLNLIIEFISDLEKWFWLGWELGVGGWGIYVGRGSECG